VVSITKGLAFGGLCLLMAVTAQPVRAQDQKAEPTAKQIEDGKKIFTGKGNCYTCHNTDGKGTPLAPDLTDTTWINIDGSWAAIEGLVKTGVPKPKEHPAPMPAMGGASLNADELKAVAAYVWSLSHKASK
jgi:mono/diheme cytochrome c family protein